MSPGGREFSVTIPRENSVTLDNFVLADLPLALGGEVPG